MTYQRGVLLVAIAAIGWSLTGLALRNIAVADTWQVLFWRSAGMVPVLSAAIILRSRGRLVTPVLKTGLAGLIGGMGLVVAFSGAIYALQTTTVANASFLFAASPLLAAILGWIILGERLRPQTMAAIALAGAGMFLMVREGLSIGAGLGNATAVLSASGFAIFTLTLRWRHLSDMLPAILIGALLTMIVSGGAILAEGGVFLVPALDIAISVGLGAVILAGGLWLYTEGARVLPAADLTLLAMIEVVLAPIWVWLAFDETASAGTFIGGAVLLGALAFNALAGARTRTA